MPHQSPQLAKDREAILVKFEELAWIFAVYEYT